MSENYRDFWNEFRTIQALTQKKLLKKPNLHEALKHFSEFAISLEEAEMPELLALCSREIATLYGKLGNPAMEKRNLLKAAYSYFEAATINRRMNLAVESNLPGMMELCYLGSIEQLLREGCLRLAGLTFLEMAVNYETLDEPQRAFAFLKKANHFAQGDIYTQLQILERLTDLVEAQINFEESMTELQTAWNELPKDKM